MLLITTWHFHPVAPFSGGEKARLVLAMLVYQKPNVLLLDEPTNHLDLEMRHALTIAMQSFEGAMIIVSHDRHLLRTVTDTLFLVAHGSVEPFDGDLDDYKQWISNENKLQKSQATETKIQEKSLNKTPLNSKQNISKNRTKIKPLENKLRNLDKKMAQLTSKKDDTESKLSVDSIYDPNNKEMLDTLLTAQSEITIELDKVESEWMEVSEELDALS